MSLLKILFFNSLFIVTVVTQDSEVLYRLSDNVKPSQYILTLTLGSDFYQTKTFEGTVKIIIETDKDLQIITMNSADIDYTGATITTKSGENQTITFDFQLDENIERVNFTVNQTLPAGTYELLIENYKAKLHEDMYGFYLSSYTNGDGDIEYIATTQFQPTYARRAFPCFDEPKFKAKFSIAITRPADYTSLGNTYVETDNNTDYFSETPVMSTYLVAFIVSKFKGYGGQNSVETLKYDVWCREEAIETANYSYLIGQLLLDKLSNYTEINYYEMEGVTKMDQVAIPDFAAGAMENWGLVTYRETALLWDPHESTRSNLQRVATVIAHEFAHMWFGNLVTLEWWSYTWLNEGFARYYQYFITAEVIQDWELEKQFVIEQQQVIFVSDALESAAALSSNALTTNQISNKFASISYNKGASVIRMMKNFLGDENYVRGIKLYLYNHKYNNTTPEDLFTDLSVSDVDHLPTSLSNIMKTWTIQPGYPVVTVSRNTSGFKLIQERFLFNTTAESTLQWYVPITYTTESEKNFEDTKVIKWLTPQEELFIEAENETGWIIVNLLETGYYRVNYDDELWDELENVLKLDNFDNIFPELNRAQIVDDVFNLARANKLTYNRALSITSFLANETSYFPWYAAFNAFSFLRRRIDSSDYVGETLELHISTMMEKLYQNVSFNMASNLSHIDTLKTAVTLQWACELNNKNCMEEASQLFDSYRQGESINPNIRSTVYCSALRQANSSDHWDFLWKQYGETKLATEQATILTALGCSKNEDILNKYLQLSINGTSGIRKQDANSVYSAVLSGNLGNVDIAFRFLRDNVENITNYYEGMNALSSVINGIADRLTTQDQIDEFEQFIDEKSEILKDAALQAQTALENAKANIKWVESNMEELNNWLYQTYGSATSITLNVTLFVASIALINLNFK